jgi:hypothetical protein
MRQIAQLTEAIARATLAKPEAGDVNEDDISTSIGLDLDLAIHLPEIPDPRQSLLVGLALARRAQRAVTAGDFYRAAQSAVAAERFMTDGLKRQPDLNSPAVAEARTALQTLWE